MTRFNEKRGVGYISCKEPDDDSTYVVRQAAIAMPGYAVLEEGQFVEFEVAAAAAGDEAAEVEVENVWPATAE